MSAEDGPLSRLKVIDASNMLAGPIAAGFLADFGAQVIKLEHPGKGDSLRALGAKKGDVPLFWKVIGRNKRAITLNLAHTEGQEVFRDLVKDADVVVENYRPGTMEKWGIGYKQLKAINPRIVMLRITGFGQTGPYAKRPGFGTISEAMCGFANANGFPDRPPLLPPYGIADQVTGLAGAFSIMLALQERSESGQGQFIDLGIYESMFHLLGPIVLDYDQLGIIQKRQGNRIAYQAPRNCYQTKDGRWVALSGGTNEVVGRLFTAIGRPELFEDPRFCNNEVRLQNIEELDKILVAWMGERTLDQVMKAVEKYECAIFPAYDISQIFADPHYQARENIVSLADEDLGQVRMQGIIPKLSRTPGKVKWAGPRKGQHNTEVYGAMGYSEERLAKLKSMGVI
jgi:formyl-CoA transferase